jgi:hypothetical protein
MATFSNTQTVAQLGNKGIFVSVINNPKTGSLFLTDEAGTPIGAVSSKIEAEIRQTKAISPDYVISDITDEETGETFKMLHKAGGNNDNLIASTRPSTAAVASSQANLNKAF